MDEVDAFFQSILDSPDDDRPRLIYADWLEERGDPRGELIQVQCELAKMPTNDPRRPGLQARAQGLQTRFTHEALGGAHISFCFSRGLLETVYLGGDPDVRVFVERAPVIYRLGPVRRLHVIGPALDLATVEALAKLPYLCYLSELCIPGMAMSGHTGIDVAGVQALAASPYLTRLTSLDLSANTGITASALQKLLDSPSLNRLTKIDLSADWVPDEIFGFTGPNTCPAVDPSAVQALATSPNASRLTALNLWGNSLDEEAGQSLVDSPFLTGLAELHLEHCGLSPSVKDALRARFGDRVRL
jgi:uncharacterized protein (TIGR02996 family)